jgi:hypothetical protein
MQFSKSVPEMLYRTRGCPDLENNLNYPSEGGDSIDISSPSKIKRKGIVKKKI